MGQVEQRRGDRGFARVEQPNHALAAVVAGDEQMGRPEIEMSDDRGAVVEMGDRGQRRFGGGQDLLARPQPALDGRVGGSDRTQS